MNESTGWLMNRVKNTLLMVSALFAAALLSGPALAGPSPTVTQTKDVDFDVTVEAANLPDCSELNFPLRLMGTSQLTVVDSTRKGVHQIMVHAIVHGIAQDGAGNTFVFSYANNLRTSVSLASGEYVVNFDTDNFTMASPAGHITISFVGALIYSPIDDPVHGTFIGFTIDHAHGDANCDPI
jgi:hypothetical protein